MKNILLVIMAIQFMSGQSAKSELGGLLGRPAFSPDGRKIAFVHAPDAARDVWEIYVADRDGKNAQRLTHFPEARIKKGPVWSPDGRKIAFHGDVDDGAQIFIMNADGSNLVQLTDLPDYNVEPHWSPEGERLVFNVVPVGGKVKMFEMNPDGTDVRPLHNPDGQNWYPRICRKGRIVFTSDVDHKDQYNIFTMDRDGSDLQQLTSLKGINWFPEYSPDGSQIVFHSNRDDPELSDSGDFNLYLMDTDGTNLRRITNLEGQELHAKWDPSENQLIFEWHNKIPMGLYLLDLSSGEVKKVEIMQPETQRK